MSRSLALSVALVAAVPATPGGAAPGLYELAEPHQLLIGTAVDAYALLNEVPYIETLVKEFNAFTPENVMKMEVIHPEPDVFHFTEGDQLVDFAEPLGGHVRGHALIWDQQMPAWFADGNWTKKETRQILEDHIAGVAGHYRGRLWAWDVVNEAIGGDGKPRQTIWSKAGKDYISRAFRAARAADPDALLCYNDFFHEDRGNWQQPRADGVYELVAAMVRRGDPIDCVGFQFHLDLDFDPVDIAGNFQRYADLGIDVHITELDVRIEEPITTADLKKQAQIYREVLKLCLEAPTCTAFIVWGFTDGHSWIPYFLPGWGGATLFDEAYHKKPAYKAVAKTLKKTPPG
jgi:endo-1,4-beta-xylanase